MGPNEHSRMARSMFKSHVLSTIAPHLPEVTSLIQKLPLGHFCVKHSAKCCQGCQICWAEGPRTHVGPQSYRFLAENLGEVTQSIPEPRLLHPQNGPKAHIESESIAYKRQHSSGLEARTCSQSTDGLCSPRALHGPMWKPLEGPEITFMRMSPFYLNNCAFKLTAACPVSQRGWVYMHDPVSAKDLDLRMKRGLTSSQKARWQMGNRGSQHSAGASEHPQLRSLTSREPRRVPARRQSTLKGEGREEPPSLGTLCSPHLWSLSFWR